MAAVALLAQHIRVAALPPSHACHAWMASFIPVKVVTVSLPPLCTCSAGGADGCELLLFHRRLSPGCPPQMNSPAWSWAPSPELSTSPSPLPRRLSMWTRCWACRACACFSCGRRPSETWHCCRPRQHGGGAQARATAAAHDAAAALRQPDACPVPADLHCVACFDVSRSRCEYLPPKHRPRLQWAATTVPLCPSQHPACLIWL